MDTLIFVKAGTKDIKKLLPLINDISQSKKFSVEKTTIMMAFLPFYQGCQLLEVMDHDSFPIIKRRFVYNREENEIYSVDYKDETLQKLNNDIPLFLDESTAADYVRFYFDMVIGDYGRFYVVESIDDIPWLEDPTPQLRKSMASLVQDISITAQTKNDYTLKVSLLFKNSLFEAMVKLTKTGEVSILSQDILLQDMPVHDQALGH
ncbi:MAG: hypothetical protein CMH30_01375 [Micavibrio sp.]|nr:hypothetical protein [Micavibrio sp.]|tara:strand:- start:4853 stop:5470 length:618 start_codon:yes stop_codon:yes gene_type:complete